MNTRLVNTDRISISNFTLDSKTNTISFFSTKTNKCWSKKFEYLSFVLWHHISQKSDCTQKMLTCLKKLCKNGN